MGLYLFKMVKNIIFERLLRMKVRYFMACCVINQVTLYDFMSIVFIFMFKYNKWNLICTVDNFSIYFASNKKCVIVTKIFIV